jgi:hypothetical protein
MLRGPILLALSARGWLTEIFEPAKVSRARALQELRGFLDTRPSP